MKKRKPADGVERVTLNRVEVAALLGIGTSKVQELTNTGRIPYIRFGRIVLYPREQVLNWISKLPRID